MSPDLPPSVRVNQQAKDQLIKLKRITGIRQWNVLCRWALCTSLADPSPPLVRSIKADSNVEMSWRTFAGPLDAAFIALLRHRIATTSEGFDDLTDALGAHLHRGIGQLSGSLQNGDDITTLIGLTPGKPTASLSPCEPEPSFIRPETQGASIDLPALQHRSPARPPGNAQPESPLQASERTA